MELTLYSAAWCPDCREAKRFLAKHNAVPYRDIDVETRTGSAWKRSPNTPGKQAIPQFVIDGEWVQPYVPGKGFLYDDNGQAPGNPLEAVAVELVQKRGALLARDTFLRNISVSPVHHLPYRGKALPDKGR